MDDDDDAGIFVRAPEPMVWSISYAGRLRDNNGIGIRIPVGGSLLLMKHQGQIRAKEWT